MKEDKATENEQYTIQRPVPETEISVFFAREPGRAPVKSAKFDDW